MAGVSLVGYSGSLIKDTVKGKANLMTAHSTNVTSDPIDQVDVTKALVGMVNHLFHFGVLNWQAGVFFVLFAQVL